ncbi:hypothetical protein ITP53_54590 [Nonomuraea sp. K274]|uniref:Uncharacterized protein n=1 Tax=Nonomuraea cypriaca TaxID=1187855 RepID=A0A931F415_9ACTN|nr:hypothetical protein [Nonomuraea cypriaca]MBF8194539.1 hypothetical protein [Nonomuraea cypriaca]
MESLEEPALKILTDRGETGAQVGKFVQERLVLDRRLGPRQRLELLALGPSGTGQVGVAALQPFAEGPVDLVVPGRDLGFDLREHVVKPLVQVE